MCLNFYEKCKHISIVLQIPTLDWESIPFHFLVICNKNYRSSWCSSCDDSFIFCDNLYVSWQCGHSYGKIKCFSLPQLSVSICNEIKITSKIKISVDVGDILWFRIHCWTNCWRTTIRSELLFLQSIFSQILN